MPVFFRIIYNLYYKLLRLMIYPMYLLSRNGFRIVVSLIVFYVAYQFIKAPDETDTSAPLPAVQQVMQREDGNSSFASDLIAQMQPDELRYYSQNYYWVMRHQPAGEAHEWNYHNVYGRFVPDEAFKNNYGHTCRRFSEVLKVGSTQQTLDGIGCEKPDGSWCKLGKSFTPVCGIAPKKGFGAWWDKKTRDLF